MKIVPKKVSGLKDFTKPNAEPKTRNIGFKQKHIFLGTLIMSQRNLACLLVIAERLLNLMFKSEIVTYTSKNWKCSHQFTG